MLLILNVLQGAPKMYLPALVSPEELHVAIFVPCSDKFTVPQHARGHVHVHSEASHALTRPAHSARPARSDTSSTSRSFTRTSKQLAQQACGLFDGGHLA